MKAVIPAAGMGTRMLPATKSMPKEMLPVVDKPVIQYVVEEAVASGCDEILIVTGRGKRAIEDHFDHSFELEHHLREKGKQEELQRIEEICDLADIHYVRQKEPRGLGHALLCARRFIGDEPFAVLLGDDIVTGPHPATQQLIDVHEQTGGSVVGATRVPREELGRYGVFDVQGTADASVHKVTGLVEKPRPEEAPSDLAVMGRYILDPQVLSLLAETPPGFGGEVQLTDAIDRLAKAQDVFAVPLQGMRLDAGDTRGWLAANVRMALADPALGPDLQVTLRALLDLEVAP